MIELTEVVNIKGKPTGLIDTFNKAMHQGDLHRGIRLAIYTNEGKVLLQKRSSSILFNQNLWDISMGGLVDANETPEQAAIRELNEEMGIKISEDQLEPIGVWHYHHHLKPDYNKNELLYVYLVQINQKTNFTLQESEVSKYKYIPVKELEKMINEHIDAEHIIPLRSFFLRVLSNIEERL
ncbi:MAG TPA: NUDIX domain-containing protein [Candidatus Saccharimonadales bacterium]|nr:NUDIX domain-containing protein [Candidatus Saccharimonadales bacterium]